MPAFIKKFPLRANSANAQREARFETLSRAHLNR
jgi:hypothetical protein